MAVVSFPVSEHVKNYVLSETHQSDCCFIVIVPFGMEGTVSLDCF